MADVMEVSANIRLLLTRNGADYLEQVYSSTATSYDRHAADRVVLTTNMAGYQEASLGDINATNLGKNLIVVSDQLISIGVNTTSQNISAEALMMMDSSISHLYLKNTNTNTEATLQFLVTD